MKTLLLKKDEVRQLIGMAEVIGAVEEAYKGFNSDQVEQPDYIGIDLPSPRGEIDFKLGYYKANEVISTGAMKRNKVGDSKHVVNARQLARGHVKTGNRMAVKEDDVHTEAKVASPCHSLPDPPHSNDADGLSGHVGSTKMRRTPTCPFASPQFPLPFPCASRAHQKEGHRQIGGRIRQHAWRVCDNESGPCCRRYIDMIEANAEVTENLCSNTPLENVGADLIGHGWQDRIGFFKRGSQFTPI